MSAQAPEPASNSSSSPDASPSFSAAQTPAQPDAPPAAGPSGTVTISPDSLPPQTPSTPLSPSDLPTRIGRFEIRRLLGEGVFGRVFEAYDPQLKRSVALKVAKPEQLASARRLERFLREAQAAARLIHPNIVAFFETGQDGGHHFIASAFVPGQPLDVVLQQQPTGQTLPLPQAVQIVRQLAEALAHAHQQSVIHRDVKPANVLLREDGVPLLTDFGLAARADETEKLTQAGGFLGTAEYMAPEQWRGQAAAGSDQYSLGVLLFELLTGRLPFVGSWTDHYLLLHTQMAVPSPRGFRPQLPRDLETVCLKCLDKEPQQRYPSCAALAEDLARWQRGEPVTARPVGWLERGGRWSRRNPLAAGLLAAVVLVLLLGAGVSTGLAFWALAEARQKDLEATNARKAEEQASKNAEDAGKASTAATLAAAQALKDRDRAEEEKQKKVEELRRTEWAVYRNQITLAHGEWQHGSEAAMRRYLDGCQNDLRGWEYHYLAALLKKAPSLKGHTGSVNSVTFSPDGKQLVSGSSDKTVKLWDADKGSEILTLQGHTSLVNSVAFSPDGKRIVSGSWDKTVKVWDADKGSEILSLKGHTNAVSSVAFSADGKRIVSGSQDHTVKVWDADKGTEILSLKGHTAAVLSVAFSADGKRVLGKDVLGKILVWDLSTGRLLPDAPNHFPVPPARTCSPDGRFEVEVAGATIRIHDRLRRQQQLARVLQQLARIDPDWHRAQAASAESQGQHFAAAFHLDRLLRLYPWDADLHIRRTHALARQGKAAEASLQLLTALFLQPHVRLSPMDPQTRVRAQEAVQAGDWPRAVAAFHSAVQQPDAAPSLWRDLLLAQAAAGQADACRQTVANIVRLLPEVKNPAQLDNLLYCCQAFPSAPEAAHLLLERTQTAIAAQRTAVTLHRHGVVLYRAGRHDQALPLLQESLRLHGKGGYVDTWLFQAMTLRQLGQGEQARQLLARFENWHRQQKFASWQDRVLWDALLREARSVVNGPRLMPRVPDPS